MSKCQHKNVRKIEATVKQSVTESLRLVTGATRSDHISPVFR